MFVASGLHVPGRGDNEEVADLLDARHLAGLFAEAKGKPLAAIRAAGRGSLIVAEQRVDTRLILAFAGKPRTVQA